MASRMEAEGVAWAGALATLVRAQLASLSGDDGGAARLLDEAALRCAAADLALHAAVARWHQGRLVGGAEGERWIREAEAFQRSQGIGAPERMAAMIAPGVRP
jgi:hypothetical protein